MAVLELGLFTAIGEGAAISPALAARMGTAASPEVFAGKPAVGASALEDQRHSPERWL
jgi:hypothetical protein